MKKEIAHYLAVYKQILKMTFSFATEYRLNVIMQGFFGVVYLLGMYFIVQVVFLKTRTLAGWTQTEATTLVLMYTFIWGFISFLYFNGLRTFTIIGVRLGEADKFLTKPLLPHVLFALSYPDTTVILQEIVVAILLLITTQQLRYEISLSSLLLFFFFMLCSIIIIYFIISSYATAAFYFTEASETTRGFITLSDSSQYPLKMYPQVIQPLLLSIIPTAFMSYIPTSFLLQKGSWQLAGIVFLIMIIAFFVYRSAWYYGWRRYTSASS